MKKWLSLALATVMLFSLSACSVSVDNPSAGSSQASSPEVTGSTVASSEAQTPPELSYIQDGDPDAIAVSSEHFSMTQGEMVFMFATSFSSFYSEYGSYISLMGLDVTKSLKEQVYDETSGETWFDYFMKNAKHYAADYLRFSEAALEMGIELTEEEKKEVQDTRAGIEAAAADYGWDPDTYLSQSIGTNVSVDTYIKCLERITLCNKVYDVLVSTYQYSDEEIEAHYQANRKQYDLVDFVAVDLLGNKELEQSVIDGFAADFAAASGEEAFKAVLTEYVKAAVEEEKINEKGDAVKYAEELFDSSLESGYRYQDGLDIFEFLFGDDAAGTVFVQPAKEDAASRYAILKVRGPYPDDTAVVDVRHILFGIADYGPYKDITEAHAKADEILNSWVKNGAQESEFISLCAEYSLDGNAATGGLYEGVQQGQMVAAFNDWIFDSARKVGDYGIVDTDFGAHMMLFEGSHPLLTETIRSELMDAAYNKDMQEYEAKYPVQFVDEVLQTIVW